MTPRIPRDLARAIDYTDVRKDITYADVERVCLEARDHQVGAEGIRCWSRAASYQYQLSWGFRWHKAHGEPCWRPTYGEIR